MTTQGWRGRFMERFIRETNGGGETLVFNEFSDLTDFIDQELTAQREAILALGEGLKKKPICNRQGGCGLPFRQGVECYDGNLCEDVSVESGHNAALDAYQQAIKDMEA